MHGEYPFGRGRGPNVTGAQALIKTESGKTILGTVEFSGPWMHVDGRERTSAGLPPREVWTFTAAQIRYVRYERSDEDAG